MPNRIIAPLPMVLALLLWPSPVTRAGPSEEKVSPLQQYVGSETCLECHDEEYTDYRKSVHFQTETGEYDVKGCEACHGPGAQHAESGGESDLIFGFDNAKYTSKQRTDKCLDCHEGREITFNFRASDHMKGTNDCSSCHKPHAGAGQENLLPVSGQELCLSCHKEIATVNSLNERHRVLEGMVQCADCHDNHSPSVRAQLGGFKQEACFKCHTDKQGPFVFEHGSVRVEGCTSCHQSPHGAVNRHMLANQSTADLCYSCHTTVPSFHKGYGGPLRFDSSTNCTNCHTAIHGSNLSAAFLK